MNPNEYAGNPSLPIEVKDRVLSTYRQSVVLLNQGKTDDVIAGCDFILRMDPQFTPASQLLEQARAGFSAQPFGADAFAAPASTADELSTAREAYAQRDFQRAVDICRQILRDDLGNSEAQLIAEQSQEKMEAGPFVEQFVARARGHLAKGNSASARSEVNKARTLDADHPEIVAVDSEIAAASRASDASSAAPSFLVEPQAPAQTPASTPSDFGFSFEEEKKEEFSFGTPEVPHVPAFGDIPTQPFGSLPPSSPSSEFSGAFQSPEPTGDFSFGSPSTPAPDAAAGNAFNFGQVPASATPSAGFSFDSEQSNAAAPFSFDSTSAVPQAGGGYDFSATPPPLTPASEGSSFDFNTASVDVSVDDQTKVDQYLAEGDAALSRGNLQDAIDIWSRIFLIDVTNENASARIENARGRKIEIDRQVETRLTAAATAMAGGNFIGARLEAEKALDLDPQSRDAREQLRAIDAAEDGGNDHTPMIPPPDIAPELDDDLSLDDDPTAAAGSQKTAAKRQVSAPVATKKSSPPKALILGIVGLLIVSVGGWFAYQTFFATAAESQSAQGASTLTQAQTLASRGRFDEAIAMLLTISPSDPQHDQALSLVDDYKDKKAKAAGAGGRAGAQAFQDLLSTGRSAYEAHDYIGAKDALEKAAALQPLPGDMKQFYDDASQQVAKLDSARSMFKEGNYREAVATLEALNQQDPQNQNVKQMLSSGRFNLATMALREEKTAEAMAELDKLLQSNPGDEVAKKTRDLAGRYDGEQKDLLYRIYVKYLPLR